MAGSARRKSRTPCRIPRSRRQRHCDALAGARFQLVRGYDAVDPCGAPANDDGRRARRHRPEGISRRRELRHGRVSNRSPERAARQGCRRPPSRQVAGFTGLERPLVARLAGRVDANTFLRERGRGQARVGSLYDGSVTALDPSPHAADSHWSDPFLDGLRAPIASAMADLTVNRLNGRSDKCGTKSSTIKSCGNGTGIADAAPMSRSAICAKRSRSIRICACWSCTKSSDLVTSYFSTKLLLDQLPAYGDPQRVRLAVVPGGHMFYARDESRAALRDAGRDLIEGRKRGSSPFSNAAGIHRGREPGR